MAVDDDLAADAAAHIREGKFLHLLKPIRDLADNWNVDIANELEEYLTHLDRTGFSFDGGPSLDFAEAALLIQSSACVYSKKVEYLHTLVYQALEAVRTKRRKDDSALHGSQDGDLHADDDQAGGGPMHRARAARKHAASEEDDSLEGFLASGWDLADSKDIDLEEDPDAVAPSFSRPPAALLAMEEQLDGQQGDGDAGVYRVARCHVHISGALMLDASDAHLYDRFLRPTRRTLATPAAAAAAALGQLGPAGLGGQVAVAVQGRDAQQGQGEVEDDDEGGGAPAGFGDDDSDADGDAVMTDAPIAVAGAGQGEAQGGAAGPAGGQQLDATAQQHGGQQGADGQVPDHVAMAAQQAAIATRGKVLPITGQQQDDGEEPGGLVTEAAEAEPFDPYKPLDPQDPGDLPNKPMQVRKPGKLKKSALFARKGRVGWDSVLGFAAPAVVPGLVHQEFAYAAELLLPTHRHKGAAAAAQRGAAQARRALGQGQATAAGAAEGGALEAWGGPAAVPALGGADAMEDAGGDGEDGAGDWPIAGGVDSDDGDDAGGAEHGGHGWDDVGAADVLEGMRGHDAQRRLLDLCGGEDADGAGGGQSYEDLCRSHIDSMLAAASARQVVTELAQRVGDWRSRIDPLLKAEESRASFDLQSYGEKILGKLVKRKAAVTTAGTSTVLAFQDVASAASRHEVSRTFAAMLQLINNRNVALQQDGGPDAPFTLQLLTDVQPHKQMADKMRKGRQPALGVGAADEARQGDEGREENGLGTQADEDKMDEENVDANIQGSQAGSGLEGSAVKGKAASGKQRAARAPRAKKARGEV